MCMIQKDKDDLIAAYNGAIDARYAVTVVNNTWSRRKEMPAKHKAWVEADHKFRDMVEVL